MTREETAQARNDLQTYSLQFENFIREHRAFLSSMVKALEREEKIFDEKMKNE